MLKAVIFDLDDTLIDWSKSDVPWETILATNLRPVADHLTTVGYTMPPLEQFVEIFQRRIREAWQSSAPPDWPTPDQQAILQTCLQEMDVTTDDLDIEMLHRKFDWDAVPGVEPFPDTIDVLTQLREAGLKIGLLTNASQPMWMRDTELETLGLRHLLDVRYSAGDVGYLKPNPEPFRVVMNDLGVGPEEALYVGDRPHDDVQGAHAAGMRGVWIRRPHKTTLGDGIRPNAIIDSLTELLTTLDRWFPRWRA